MSQQNINRGSEWNRWDLHIHTKTSHDIGDQAYGGHDADELLIDALHTQNIKVAAITDHFCIDIDRFNQLNQIITDKKYDITLFPGVELRTDKGSTNIHVILIFDNFDYDSHQLKLLSDNFSYFVRNKSKGMRNEQTINEKNFNSVYWDYKDILEFAEKHDAIISIHAGKKSNGIDDKINNKEEINMAVKDDYATTVDIFEVSKQRDIKDYKHKVFQEVKERPVIICSDNHDPRKYDINNDKKLWIKAEPSFLGLKQAIMDPSDRVFVGEEPPKIKNINKFPEQYMSSICIKPKNNTEQNNWFDAEIPLSYGLTTIIGNKGNGKSALSDIISFVAESKNTDYFSFLTTDRFCEQENKYYKKYTSKITWKNGNITEKEDLDIQKSNKEQLKDKVKYLPQNYIENLCNSLNEDFQKEIDSLIFSYLNPDDRLETKNMNELINEKSKALSSQRKDLENKISNLNKELVELEKKYTIAEKNRIQTNLDNVNDDYQKHLTSEPKSVESKKDDTSDFERKLDEINSKITSLNNQKNEYCHEKTCIAKNKNSLEQYKIDLKSLNNQFQELYENIKKINSGLVSQNYLQSNNILFNSLKDDIDKYITNLIGKEEELDITISNLDQDIKEQEQNLNQLKTSKSKQDHDIIRKLEWEKKSQEYLNKINKYKNQQKEFENYSNTINDIKTQRNQYINALSQCIDQEKEIYSDIYHTVNQKITTSLKDIEGVDISFDISLELDDNIIDFIYNTVNKSIQSPYHQVDKSFVQNMFLNTDLHHVENRLKLIDEILNDLSCSDNQKGIIDDKKYNKLIKDRVIFYNKISCLDYLKYNFVIKYEGKKLDLLSPGERGTVLLILFLILDRDKKPLIIDQPEDNLDNQTIYTKLVPSIKKAKQERQIVLVTHNPNLAIACDSELIISCKKQNTHIKYTSGSLENMSTKKILVDILEGTQPAFDLRGSNYNSEIFPKSSS